MRITSTVLFLFITSISFGQWSEVGTIPFFDHHTNGYGVDGKGYAIQGTPLSGLGESQNRLWEYDPSTQVWTHIAMVEGPGRRVSIGDDMDGKYYFGFGYGGENFEDLSDLWVFDPSDMSFTELTPCPCVGRSHPAFVAYEGKIFMGSGSGPDNDLNDWWVYDIAEDSWSQKENIPGPIRHHPFQFAIDDGIFVGGGHVDSWSRYDINTEEWTSISNVPQGRVAGTQFYYDGKGFVLSGNNREHGAIPESEFFMMYDAESDLWLSLPPHPGNDRWACSNFIIDDELYLFGGIQRGVMDSMMWKFDMRELDCLAPSALSTFQLLEEEAQLFWASQNTSLSDTLYWKRADEELWNVVPDATATYTISNLEACTDYEFYVQSECEEKTSLSSDVFEFTTEGCCTNSELQIGELSENQLAIYWTNVMAADDYEIRIKETDEEDWTQSTVVGNVAEFTDLLPCTEYEIQIKSNCEIAEIEFSESFFVLTKGCGPCLDFDYCAAPEQYNGEFAFIEEVRINEYENTSGSNGGYGNFGGVDSPELVIGEDFTFDVIPGFGNYDSYVAIGVWIDYNGDGEFDNSELILEEDFVENGLFETLSISEDAVPGLTRLRVIADWFEINSACMAAEFADGEVEDYCIELKLPSSTVEIPDSFDFSVLPNPFEDELIIASSQAELISKISLSDVLGRVHQEYSNVGFTDQVELKNIKQLMTGVYIVQLWDKDENLIGTTKVIKN